MNFRKRKKKPPDPMLPPSASPIARRSCVDLTISLAHSHRDLQAVSFSCSWSDCGFSVGSNSCLARFSLQLIVGVQRMIWWFRMHLPSTTIQAGPSVQFSCVCDGLVVFTRWNSSTFPMVSIIQFRGLRSAIVERICQDAQICSDASTVINDPSGTFRADLCVGNGLVGFTQWNSFTFTMISIIQLRGFRSAIVGSICQDGQICSVGAALFYSLFRDPSQIAGDEVKGVCPIVYEDMLSETGTSVPLAIFSVYYSQSRNFGIDPLPLFSVLVLWACLFGVLVPAYEDGLAEARLSSSSTSSRDSKSNVFLRLV